MPLALVGVYLDYCRRQMWFLHGTEEKPILLFVPEHILIPSEILLLLVHTTPDLTKMEFEPLMFPC